MTNFPEYQSTPIPSPVVHPKITLGEIQVCIYSQPLQLCRGLARLLTSWHNARTIPLLAGFHTAKMVNISRQRAASTRHSKTPRGRGETAIKGQTTDDGRWRARPINSKLSFGLPPYGRVPSFAIRNSKSPMLHALCPMPFDKCKRR